MRHPIIVFALCTTAASVVLACSDDVARMAGHMMVDAGRRLQKVDASVSDASAQSGSDAAAQSQCGTCVATDPVKVKDPIKVMTADTDAARIVGGSAGPGDWQELASGPLIATDLLLASDESGGVGFGAFAIASSGKCGSKRENLTFLEYDRQTSIHGARLMIGQGQVLCATSTTVGVRWSGFRPYE